MLEEAQLLDQDYEDGSNRTWATQVTIDGLTYAASLFWQPLQNTEDPIAEVSESAEGIMEGADLFCIKQGKAPQFGICASQQGYKNGMNVGAIPVATALGGQSSFVAVFKVQEGWWYICVRNDIILSDGDMVFLKEEDAKSQFMYMLAVPDWGKKIAPKDWEIEGTEEVDVSTLVSKGNRAKLQKIKALRGTKLFMVIGVSAVVGIWLLSTIIDSIFLAPPKRPMIAPVKPKVVKPVEKIPEIKPWEKVKDPNQVMTQCYDYIAALAQIMPPGWKIGEITCNAGGVSTSWKREVGRIAWIDEALEKSQIKFGSKAISDDGNNLVVSVPLDGVKTVASKPTYASPQLKITINDLFQSINQPVALSDGSEKSNLSNVYRTVKFKFSSVNNPVVWRDLLTKFSGLEVTMIKYRKDGNMWDYEGAIYVL